MAKDTEPTISTNDVIKNSGAATGNPYVWVGTQLLGSIFEGLGASSAAKTQAEEQRKQQQQQIIAATKYSDLFKEQLYSMLNQGGESPFLKDAYDRANQNLYGAQNTALGRAAQQQSGYAMMKGLDPRAFISKAQAPIFENYGQQFGALGSQRALAGQSFLQYLLGLGGSMAQSGAMGLQDQNAVSGWLPNAGYIPNQYVEGLNNEKGDTWGSRGTSGRRS